MSGGSDEIIVNYLHIHEKEREIRGEEGGEEYTIYGINRNNEEK